MNLIEQKMLDAYFEKPPLTDYLSLPTGDHSGVLGCSITDRAVLMMVMAERAAADRARRSHVSRQRDDDTIGLHDSYIEPTAKRGPKVLVGSTLPPMERQLAPPPVRPTPWREKPGLPARRNASRLSAGDMRGDPLLALTKDQRSDKINVYRWAAKIMCEESDWDEDLRIAGPKIIDQLLFMAERLTHNVEQAQKRTVDQINALQRQTMGDEIPIGQIERLERRLKGLHVQQRHFQLMFYAFGQEREPAIARSGLDNWERFEGIKQRAQRSHQEYVSKVRRRNSLSMVVEHMSDAEYRKWVASTTRYEPRRNGVEATDDDGGSAE